MTASSPSIPQCPEEQHAWALLVKARELVDRRSQPEYIGLRYDEELKTVNTCDPVEQHADLSYSDKQGWHLGTHLDDQVVCQLEFYLPVLGLPGNGAGVLAHLGQSVDARIATLNGDSQAVTGHENIIHLHKLRALSHAVLVGGSTASADDPQLTTRLVSGENPVRVIIDSRSRLAPTLGVFNDAAAPTIWVNNLTRAAQRPQSTLALPDHVERLGIDADSSDEFLLQLIRELADRGLNRLFIEGGGITVTRFMELGKVDRLQIASSPVLIGDGQAALHMPPAASMHEALRPPCRLYRMGKDVLWDFDISAVAAQRKASIQSNGPGEPAGVSLQRLY